MGKMHSLKEIKSLFKFLSETLQDYGTMPIFKRTFSQDLDLLEQHLTKDILSRTDCTTTLTDLRTTFENAFNSELKAPLNVDSLKVDLVVIQDTCSEKEDSNSEMHPNKLVKEHVLCLITLDSRFKSLQSTLLQHLGNVKKSVAERTRHQRQYDRRVNKRQMQTQESKIDTGKALDADLVETESIRDRPQQCKMINSVKGMIHMMDNADFRPIYDEDANG
ncbi:hypothetical protein Tco_0375675 [Tanacetum coccineum]